MTVPSRSLVIVPAPPGVLNVPDTLPGLRCHCPDVAGASTLLDAGDVSTNAIVCPVGSHAVSVPPALPAPTTLPATLVDSAVLGISGE